MGKVSHVVVDRGSECHVYVGLGWMEWGMFIAIQGIGEYEKTMSHSSSGQWATTHYQMGVAWRYVVIWVGLLQ